MVELDIAQAKIATIQRCLTRIKAKTRLDPQSLHDIDTQDIFVLNLQRAIQAALDLAAHLISGQGWGLPMTLKEHFSILAKQGILEHSLAQRLEKMTGFRNIAVHDYQALDLVILQRILQSRLVDLDQFCQVVLKYLDEMEKT